MDPTISPDHVVTTPEHLNTDDAAPARSPLRLHSLAELGQVLDQFASSDDDALKSLSLDEALAFLASSEADLAAARAADRDARSSAEALLTRYDRARERLRAADDALTRANALVARATDLADHAFTTSARERAQAILTTARRVAEAAVRERDNALTEESSLGDDPRVTRLLAERQARQDAARAEAERAERRTRMRRAVEEARALADRHQLAEACAVLAPLIPEFPGDEPLCALYDRLRRQLRALRTQRARATLWDIRRRLRTRPADALAAVEQVDFEGLDDDLACQLFGEWLRAARRLDRPGALRHSPEPHRGALLVPHGDAGCLVVISAVGGCHLHKGQIVRRSDLRGLRPVGEQRG
jgi:hypothetical protein